MPPRTDSAALTSYGGLELVRRYVPTLMIVARLRAALAAIPSDHGGARHWLEQFTQTALAPLVKLNHDLVVEAVAAWRLPRLPPRRPCTESSIYAVWRWSA